MKSTVILDFEIEGFHHYPNAPKEVDFLRHPHRHLFQIRVGYDVTDLNREKEIFIQQAYLEEYFGECYGHPAYFDDMSCEMIADDLLNFIKYDGGQWVEVFEDGKGGAKVSL